MPGPSGQDTSSRATSGAQSPWAVARSAAPTVVRPEVMCVPSYTSTYRTLPSEAPRRLQRGPTAFAAPLRVPGTTLVRGPTTAPPDCAGGTRRLHRPEQVIQLVGVVLAHAQDDALRDAAGGAD